VALDLMTEEIVDGYPFLTEGDMQVIFRRALHGEYGEYYERLSIPKVMTWVRNYMNERVRTAMDMNDLTGLRFKH
jgi:hypothetical protein